MTTLVVLVPGLGSIENFWGSTVSELEKYSEIQQECHFYRWSYRTTSGPVPFWTKIPGLGRRYENFEQLGEHFWCDICHKFRDNRYEYLLLIGHSQGGLVIASALAHGFAKPIRTENSDVIEALQSIALIATPLAGSRIAKVINYIYGNPFRNPHIQELSISSKTRRKIVRNFIDLAIKPKIIKPTLFRAENDETVVLKDIQNFLETNDLQERTYFEIDVLRGNHTGCIHNLKHQDSNADKISEWILSKIPSLTKLETIKFNNKKGKIQDLNGYLKSIEKFLSDKDEFVNSGSNRKQLRRISGVIKSANELDKKLDLIREEASDLLKRAISFLEQELSKTSSLKQQGIKSIQEQINMLKVIREDLSVGQQIGEHIEHNKKAISREIGLYALKQSSAIGANASKIDNFCFSLEQFLDLISECLKWGTTYYLERPGIPLIFDSEIYKISIDHFRDSNVGRFPAKEEKELSECLEYLKTRFKYCPRGDNST